MAPRKSKAVDATDASDAAENPLHPRKTPAFYGHAKAEAAFLNAFYANTLHHAWHLTGERGIGKATFAYCASRFLLSQSGATEEARIHPKAQTLALAPDHPVSRQVAAGAHPSLFVLADESAASTGTGAIGVEAARKLRGFLALTSTSGWRAVIVDAANDLTGSSANALLKAIEEPPARTVFFLVSHGSISVLPTIRSRCVRLSLQPLGSSDQESAILAACASADIAAPDRDALAKLVASAPGSPGRAMALLAGGLLPLAEKLRQLLASLPKLNAPALHELVQSASGARNAETFARLCDLIEEHIERSAREQASTLKAPPRDGGWAGFWEKFRERRLEVETLNLDKGAFLIATFSDIERVARESSGAYFP